MIAFADMLLEPARKAGMMIPLDANDFSPDDYPHFAVFRALQLGAPMPFSGCHWTNANVVASVPYDEIKTITFDVLIERGFVSGFPIP